MMVWLFRTGCALGRDRGVLGCGNSRMGFRVTSENGLISSQGTPQRTSDSVALECRQGIGHGWSNILTKQQLGLELRRKRHKTESLSIQFFDRITDYAKFLMASIAFCAPWAQAVSAPTSARNVQQLAQVKKMDPIEEVGDNFEGLMLQRMYSQMVQSQRVLSQDDGNPFSPSNAEMIYRGMSEEVMLKELAKRRPLGMGKLVTRELRRQSGIPESALLNSKKSAGQMVPMRSNPEGT